MRVLSLGHSAFLLEMRTSEGAEIRILGDPWLSDHVIGDLMGRMPRVRLAWTQMPRIDGIYLSHSHTDHFDPYTLTTLWNELGEKPALLLPSSLFFLIPMLEEFLEGVEIVRLPQNTPTEFRGVSLTTLYNLEDLPSNEDDVMLLTVESENELFLAASDALFPFGDAEARGALCEFLGNDTLGSVCFLTIKNELPSLMASVHATSAAERKKLLRSARKETSEQIRVLFEPLASSGDGLWQNPRLVRLIGGQGVCFPQEISKEWNRLLFPLPLAARAAMERKEARSHGYPLQIEPFTAGTEYAVMDGAAKAARRTPPYLEILDPPEDADFDADLELFANFPEAPLFDEERDTRRQEQQIRRILNERFLPYLVGRRDPPVEHLLSDRGGAYRVRIRYGRSARYRERDFCLRFEAMAFHDEDVAGDAHEVYWANDLEDYLAGRCDDFSTFCRRPLGGEAERLWSCLGMPFLNNDLLEKKFRLHFERAARGETASDWVLRFYASVRG